MTDNESGCSFGKLIALLDNKLTLDQKLAVYDHLDTCETCRDAIYLIKRDRDETHFLKLKRLRRI